MFLTNETLQAICRTFLHSLWQGVIAAALAGIILWATRRSSARTRYNLLGFLLLLCLLTSGITFYTELGDTASAVANITGTEIDTDTAPAVLPSHPGEQVMHFINAYANWFMLAWAIIFLLKCFRLAGGFYYLHRIRRINIHPVPTIWEETILKLSKALGIKKKVRFQESGIVKTPITIGFFKPLILFPLGLLAELPADQVETILLHELAHIRRKDYLVNMLQSFTEIIFFFNPAFLWISTILREEREACCDDIVVAHTPHKATYLHALVAFEGQTGTILQMGLGNTRNHLLHRVKRMLTRENKKISLMEKIIITFGIIAITAFCFMPEKEAVATVNPMPVIPYTLESLTYSPVQDTVRIVKKIKSTATPEAARQKIPLKVTKDKWDVKPVQSSDKWVTDSTKGVSWKTATTLSQKKKRITSTDTVLFAKPVFKKVKISYADTMISRKPVSKKIKISYADTVVSSKPISKKIKISYADTVVFRKPVLKKIKTTSTDTLVLPYKKMISRGDTTVFSQRFYKKMKSASTDTAANNNILRNKLKAALTDPKPVPRPAFKNKEVSSSETVRFTKPVLKSTADLAMKEAGAAKASKRVPKLIKADNPRANKQYRVPGGSIFFEDVLPNSLSDKLLQKKSLIPDC